jgi:glucose-1-phosphate thymidylyltransferase
VEGWYDCGKPETLLETNQHLLSTTRGGIHSRAKVESSTLGDALRLEEDVVVQGSSIGPNVTLENGARVVNSTLRNCIVGPGAVIEGAELHDSLVGGHSRVQGFRGSLSVADHSEVVP